MLELKCLKIVEQVMNYGLVKGETFFTDSTHKKANANKNKHHIEIVREVKKRRTNKKKKKRI